MNRMFYFQYELKLEFIPYVEEEVKGFIAHMENKIHTLSREETDTLRAVIQKKIKQINVFYRAHYDDYRAHLSLRVRAILEDFWVHHLEYFLPPPPPQPIPQTAPEQKAQKKSQVVKTPSNNQAITKVRPRLVESIHSSTKVATRSPALVSPSPKSKVAVGKIGTSRVERIKSEEAKEPQVLKLTTPRAQKESVRGKEKKMTKEEYIEYLRRKKF